MIDIERLKRHHPVIKDISEQKEVVWVNPDKTTFAEAVKGQ